MKNLVFFFTYVLGELESELQSLIAFLSIGTFTLGSTSSSDFSNETSTLEYVLLSYEESLSSTKFIADIYNVSLLTLSEVLALIITGTSSFSVSVYDSMIFIFSTFYIDFLERAVEVPTFLIGACISI